jgi:hypothetical protein
VILTPFPRPPSFTAVSSPRLLIAYARLRTEARPTPGIAVLRAEAALPESTPTISSSACRAH